MQQESVILTRKEVDLNSLKPSTWYLVKLALICQLSFLHIGFSLSASNVCVSALKYQLGWLEPQWDTLSTIVSSCSVGGIAVGAILGG